MNCAFKLFRRSAIAGVSLSSTGALFNAELLARLRLRGHVFEEIGVHHYARRHGRQSGALLELPRVWWSVRWGEVPTRGELPAERHDTP